MKRYREILVLLLIVLFLSACNIQTSGKNINYYLSTSANNLDPQTADTNDEFLIIENTMEGLISANQQGQFLPGLAESFIVSDDGLTYTFYLRDDIYWCDYKGDKQDKITSSDFLFAFSRLFSLPNSPQKNKEFFIIKNSEDFNNKNIDFYDVGVKAPDEKTIIFTLENPSSNFLKTLSFPAAFPCNEKYFTQTQGQYGLTFKHLLYSGPFYVSGWGQNNYFVFRRSKVYYDKEIVLTEKITLPIIDLKTTSLLDEFLKEKNDIVSVLGSDFEKLNPNKISYNEYTDSSWVLIFNTKNPILENQKIRDALKYSVHFNYKNPKKPIWIEKSNGIIPPHTKINDDGLYTDYIKQGFGNLYNKELSVNSYNEGLAQINSTDISSINISFPDNEYFTSIMQEVQKSFQENLSVFINIHPTPIDELEQRYKDLDFDIILYNIVGNANSPYRILSEFSQFFGENMEYNNTLLSALEQENPKSSAELFFSAEQMIIESSIVYPVLYQSSFQVRKNTIENIIYSTYSESILFKYAYKN